MLLTNLGINMKKESANYFNNVVYPEVRGEHTLLADVYMGTAPVC